MPADQNNNPDNGSGEPETVFDLHPKPAATPSQSPEPAMPEPEPSYPTRAAPPLVPLPAQPNEKKGPEPTDESRYDFFLQDKPKPKKTPIPLPVNNPGSPLIKVVIVAVGIFLLLGLFAFIISILNSGNKSHSQALTSLVFSQQEIIRLSDTADEKLRSASLQNFAITTKQTTTSAQQDLTAHLARQRIKLDAKQLEGYAVADNDEVMNAAEAADTYDASYKTLMGELLTDYLGRLKSLQAGATTIAERDLLAKEVNSAQLLQTMLEQS